MLGFALHENKYGIIFYFLWHGVLLYGFERLQIYERVYYERVYYSNCNGGVTFLHKPFAKMKSEEKANE